MRVMVSLVFFFVIIAKNWNYIEFVTENRDACSIIKFFLIKYINLAGPQILKIKIMFFGVISKVDFEY